MHTQTVKVPIFALFSDGAQAVQLCLFDDDGAETRLPLTEVDGYVWHGYVPGVGAGQRYGYRVDGRWEPANGLRFNANKLLLDPYARARNDEDSAAHSYRSVVVPDGFDWTDAHGRADTRPDVPYHRSVLYEAHAKGVTALHPDVPDHQRGTYAGVAHLAVVAHLKNLGVTAVELRPVHQFVRDNALEVKGLRNYWGDNTIGFFAPHHEYASSSDPCGQVREFKEMVKDLHANGLEVILDVVYNHTAEGNHLGPRCLSAGLTMMPTTGSSRGSRSTTWTTPGRGTRSTSGEPHALQLIMDSLRYWVTEMHVDGFRFDLAATLAREFYDVDKLSSFFEMVQQDPVVSQVKLIAEPWDLGPGGYQVGNFPPQWTEWNGKFRDGESHNRSWNFGVEGPTDDAGITVLRARQQRNFLTTLLLSQGVPMILHGGRTGQDPKRQQQRLRPGFAADVDQLGGCRHGTGGLCLPAGTVAGGAPRVPPSQVLQRAAGGSRG